MPRSKRKRIVNFSPTTTYFKPVGVPLRELEEVVLAHEELEALRLQDLSERSQEESAQQMNISQPTFHRLITVARKKIANALVNGKAIKIEGGDYSIEQSRCCERIIK